MMLVRRLTPMGPPRVRRSNLGDLDRMRHDMLHLFDALMGPGMPARGVFPAVNVTQDADNFYIRCELPGVKPEDLDIGVVHRTVTVSGKRDAELEEGVSYHRKERASGTFSRSIVLPAELEAEGMDAVYEHGVLTITLPVAEVAKPRQIAVRSA